LAAVLDDFTSVLWGFSPVFSPAFQVHLNVLESQFLGTSDQKAVIFLNRNQSGKMCVFSCSLSLCLPFYLTEDKKGFPLWPLLCFLLWIEGVHEPPLSTLPPISLQKLSCRICLFQCVSKYHGHTSKIMGVLHVEGNPTFYPKFISFVNSSEKSQFLSSKLAFKKSTNSLALPLCYLTKTPQLL